MEDTLSVRSEYFAYKNAKQRCTNTKHIGWKDYGGRGIEFRFSSFEEFFAELGPRPKGFVLDRKDNDGHYEKGNVRWATQEESLRNRRHTKAQIRACKKAGKASGKKHSQWVKDHPIKASAIGSKGAIARNHNQYHVLRGIVKDGCVLCQERP